jgi:S1-C subfamily serine protease
LGQSITASDEGDGRSEQLTDLIETNADIQAGDSGGPLVNSSGQVIGIDTAGSAGFSVQSNSASGGTQGYAIPINTALSIAREIEAGQSSSTVHIGATAFLGVEIESGTASANGFASGAVVAGVVTSSPAQEAGLAQGDVITAVGGEAVDSANDLTTQLAPEKPGDKVSITSTDSSGQSQTATIQLTSGPPQ